MAAAWAQDEHAGMRVALAFGPNTDKEDGSFISTVMDGAQKAQNACGFTLESYHRREEQHDAAFLTKIAESAPDAILVIGFNNMEAVLHAAEDNPTIKFLILDGVVPPFIGNAKSIIFREHEGSFLVGMIAALKSETGKIAFIGGRDIPLIQNFAYGFEQGARYVKPDITIYSKTLGTGSEAWDDASTAKEQALIYYAQDVDIIFAAAGASGMGVLKAAKETGRFAIGVDRNQNGMQPGHVLTSLIKRVDIAVYQALDELHQGTWTSGVLNLGLKEKALDYSLDEHNQDLLDNTIIQQVEDAKRHIIERSLVVEMYHPGI